MQADVKQLVACRRAIAEMEDAFNEAITPLKLERDALQAKITEGLKVAGVLSSRFQNATVSLAVRKTVKVLDEAKVVAALKEKGLTDYVAETLTPPVLGQRRQGNCQTRYDRYRRPRHHGERIPLRPHERQRGAQESNNRLTNGAERTRNILNICHYRQTRR